MDKSKMIALVQGQLDAYNQRDLESFCSFFDTNIRAVSLADDKLICEGMDSFRRIYADRFNNNPELFCNLKSRTVLGNSVLDEEWVTGVVGAQAPSHVVAIYHFNESKISKVYFTR